MMVGILSAPTDMVVAALASYRDTVAKLRENLLGHRYGIHPQLRAQGLYFLQNLETVAFNMYIAPRQQYPALYTQSMFMPYELSWGSQNPDFLNHNGFIDGAHTYRIYGNAKGSYWATLQVFRGFWGDASDETIGHVDFDDVPKSADGDFELFLGPHPPAEKNGRVWVKTDADAHNCFLALREVYYDWDREIPMDIHIEVLDRDDVAPIWFDEEELAVRVAKAEKFVAFCWKASSGQLDPKLEDPPLNTFVTQKGANEHGGNPMAAYVPMRYEIAPDEALIIEIPRVEAKYWGFQTTSVWAQTNDFSYHQSSISGEQARIDGDGKYRLVLSLSDPGVPNWLDPVGIPIGAVQLRWYRSETVIEPAVTRVALADLRTHLPGDTPVVAPDERKRQLSARSRASLRRYRQ